MAFEIVMPHMGEGVIEGTIGRWLVKEGEFVEQYEPILEIETDKVTTEATAEHAGALLQQVAKEGEVVPVGGILGFLGEAGEEAPSGGEKIEAVESMEPAAAPVNGEPAAPPPAPIARPSGIGRISPVVGRIADERQIDLTLVVGTGLNGRITKRDVLAYIEDREKEPMVVKPIPPEMPAAIPFQPTQPPLGEVAPLSSIRRAIADHMVHSKATSPHVTTVFEVDFANVMAHRRANKAQYAQNGVNLTLTAYIVMATAEALRAYPYVNSVWQDAGIELKREINIGIATAIPDGLIVPVLKGADGLSLLGIARGVNDLAQRARAGQLRPDEVQGGTFTLTNHGISGSLFATPIINQPQCGILGVGKIEKRVKVIDDAIAIRPLAYVGLTFDHRILDGAAADGFVANIKESLERWEIVG